LGSTLRYVRKRAGLSQRELALQAGVTQPAVARIEGGKTSPRFETVERLLAACGWELEARPLQGLGIDRSAIRELLRLAPAERAQLATEEARNLEALLRASRS